LPSKSIPSPKLRTLAESSEGGINEVVDMLLRKGLAAGV
jgi:hypothetical protein